MAKDDIFIGHIKEGFSRFSIDVETDTPLDKDLHKLVLTDNINSVSYIALARRKDAGKPEKFWSDVLDNILAPQLASAAEEGGVPPAALVVPSMEGETVVALANQKGANPTVYQLFDGFVVVGFRRFDSEKLIHPSPRKSEDDHSLKEDLSPQNTITRGFAKEESPSVSALDSLPEAVLLEQNPAPVKKIPLSLKKLAAAALLGVSIASIPFAINKFSGGGGGEEAAEHTLTEREEFVQREILNSALEGREENEPLLKVLAQNAPLDVGDLRYLIDKGYVYDVAQNPVVSEGVLEKLAASPDPKLRAGAAAGKNISETAALTLAADKEPEVRRAVAKNGKLPPSKLLELSKDKDELTRFAVLDNPNLTPEALDALEPVYADASCDNKAKIYAGPCVSTAQLVYHKNNPDLCVRRGIAQNPSTPEEVLLELAEDTDPQTKRGALSNPALKNVNFQKYFPVGWHSDENLENKVIRRALLENPNIPAGLLKSAALDKPEEFGTAVAKNPNTPKPILEALFNYAAGRGGVNGFLDEAAALAGDEMFLKKLSGKGDRAPYIKSRVQKAFRENIYNPEELVRFTRDESGGGVSAEDLSLEDFERGGEFFGDEAIDDDLTLEEGDEDFGEFFGETDLFETDLLETADKIVNDVINALSPIIAEKLGSLPSGNGNGSGTGAAAGGGVSSGGTTDGASFGGSAYPNRSIFSPELYQNTCMEVEKLAAY
jgi:hypothetical protein